jgi:hypothetical protein
MPDATVPVFAVVGRVNKGKSSVVAALTENDRIAISREPGTTTRCETIACQADGQLLFRLVDTPGFEQAPRALTWLQQQAGEDASQRQEAVRRFVAHHEQGDDFTEECRLLRPILDGAGILYVVDGSHPYRPNYQAEMAILRWTGQPRMALINPINGAAHVAEWRLALDQYFSIVHLFDPHRAPFTARQALLTAFRELTSKADARRALEEALRLLATWRTSRRQQTARILAEWLAESLAARFEQRYERLPPPAEQLRQGLADQIRSHEQHARRQIEELFRHHPDQREEAALAGDALVGDLFADTTWAVLGLEADELAWYGGLGGAGGGALLGGIIDAHTGGASFGTGSLLGGLIGAASGALAPWLTAERLGKIRLLGQGLQQRLARIGPVAHPQFPWILFDRGLLHAQVVLQRSHARRDALVIPDAGRQGPSSQLSSSLKRELAGLFTHLRKHPEPKPEKLDRLSSILAERLHAADATPANSYK